MLTRESRRKDFPSLSNRVYLNTAAEGIPPLIVHEALENYWRDKTAGMKGRDNHFAEHDRCRALAGSLLGKKLAEIGLCSCASEAYNLLASALQLSSNDEVVISDLDFPAGATPWLRIPEKPGVRLWKQRGGVLAIEDLAPLLTERTRLVQVSLVSFLTGYRLPWAPFRDLVRRLAPEALISVDVTQAFGRFELDCLDADCIISATHKWILGIHGGCVVAIPETSADRLTTRAGGWYHLENAFESDRFERAIPMRGAPSFSVGMPNFAAVYALAAAMDYLAETGIADIARKADPLVERLHESLAETGIETMAPPQPGYSSGIVSFQHPRDQEIHDALLQRDIHVMHQAGRLRMAIHGYNTADDIDQLVETLAPWT